MLIIYSQNMNYSQIAENYLADEVLPKLKNTTTGKPFVGKSFDENDIINEAIEYVLMRIKDPQMWKKRILTISELKQIIDDMVAATIRVMYSVAARKMNNPKERTFTDVFGKDISGEIVDPSNEYQKNTYSTPNIEDFSKNYKLLIDYLNEINPEYAIILQHLLERDESWRIKLNKIDKEIGRIITIKDIKGIITAVEKYDDYYYVDQSGTSHADYDSDAFIHMNNMIDYILSEIKRSMKYISGYYYRQKTGELC